MRPAMTCQMAVPPNAAIQNVQTTVGRRMTQIANSRTVRPRETRAMNMPTNGDHDTHHAQ